MTITASISGAYLIRVAGSAVRQTWLKVAAGPRAISNLAGRHRAAGTRPAPYQLV